MQPIDFLKAFDASGRHHLVAIHPNSGHVTGRLFGPGRWEDMQKWVDAHETHNLYFTVNEPTPDAPNTKLRKDHITNIRAVFADVDPDKGADFDAERARLHALADRVQSSSSAPASYVVDSGGGVQFFWRLECDVPAQDFTTWAEDQGRGMAHAVGGDAVHNIDRIMRLPGTTNYPTPRKRALGRVSCPTVLLTQSDVRYTPDNLKRAVKPLPAPESAVENDEAIAAVRDNLDMSTIHDLPPELRSKFAAAAARYPALKDLWEGLPTALIGDDTSGSGFRGSLAVRLCQAGGFTPQEFGQLLFNWDFAVQGDDPENKITARTIARDWVRLGVPHDITSWFDIIEDEVSIFDTAAEASEEDAQSSVFFNWIDPKAWHGLTPPHREWEVEGWIPKGEVTLLYGDGGIGKTLLAHQYATAAAAGINWLGMPTKPAKVMAMFCEDSEEELHRRQVDINNALLLDYDDFSHNLRIASRKYMDNLLTVWNNHTGEMKRTAVWTRLRDDAVKWGATVIIVDTIADTYSGSEIDRAQVNAFVKSCLGRLAQEIDGSIIALGHPSMSGMATGNGSSGSTGWSNAARSRLYLRYPEGVTTGDARELVGMKLNYGPRGALLKLKWRSGAFDVTAGNVPGIEGIKQLDELVDERLHQALAELPIQPLSMSERKTDYAPRVLRATSPSLAEFTEDEIKNGLTRIRFQPALWFNRFHATITEETERIAEGVFD